MLFITQRRIVMEYVFLDIVASEIKLAMYEILLARPSLPSAQQGPRRPAVPAGQ